MVNIKEKLRFLLLNEGKHIGNDFGCVMIGLECDKDKWKELQDIIDDKDLYEPKNETGYGKEDELHVTILYGLHEDVDDSDIDSEIKKIKIPEIKLGKVSSFKNEKFEVLKFDIESDDLHKLNKKFKQFPHTSKFPKYSPHATIAYVKIGKSEKYIDKLNEATNIKVKVKEYMYSKANGDKKHYKLNK